MIPQEKNGSEKDFQANNYNENETDKIIEKRDGHNWTKREWKIEQNTSNQIKQITSKQKEISKKSYCIH